MSLRSQTLRIASALSPKDPTRRKLLSAVVRTGTAKRVPLNGIITGYGEGPGRELMMLGPVVPRDKWRAAMKKGLAWTGGSYNDFDVDRAFKWMVAFGVEQVAPAREYSVALYAMIPPAPEDYEGVNNDAKLMMQGARRAGADEIDRVNKPGGNNDRNGEWIRLWWD